MSRVINWFEIPVTDMARAITFYQSVMQITLRREKLADAELAVFPYQQPATGGALIKVDGIQPSQQGCMIYLHTTDLAVILERVATAGGKCVFGPQQLPQGIGTIADFTDSEGNRIGLHQPS